MRWLETPGGVALGALLIAIAIALRLLSVADMDPTVVTAFGDQSTAITEYAEEKLGREVWTRGPLGHDGRFFFVQASDPWLTDPEANAAILDRPPYRSQRMLYPTLSSLGGLLPAEATAWGLIVVNVVAMGVGTAYTALVAQRMGLSPWFGLAFTLNPGFFIDISIDGAGIVAGAGLMAGIYYTVRRKLPAAAIALSAAALSRETMLIAATGLALYLFSERRRVPWPLTAPFIVTAAWWLYVHARLQEGISQDLQALSLPFVGFAGAVSRWLDEPDSLSSLAIGVLLLLVSLALLLRSVATPTELGWATAGFAALGLMLSEPVWHRYFDSARALSPVLTAYLILTAALVKAGDKPELPQSEPALT